ncbi:MAG: septum formation initiator family protein [Acutalibacteraceae bacterium]
MKLKEVEGSVKARRKKNNKYKIKIDIHSIKKSDIVFFAVVLFASVWIVGFLINQQIQIKEKKLELSQMEGQIYIQEIKNEDIYDVLDSSDSENKAYIEQSARENLDYAYKDERIFINISGE